jgi:2,3-bisphosphoglycerate-independent phosphoglycerate mutase
LKTKFFILVGDGMADYPLNELQGRTPLQAAQTPNLDRLAQRGMLGQVQTIPKGLPPGSDVANLSILGYDPTLYLTGRAPLEAASLGIKLGPRDVAFRCNLITLQKRGNQSFMEDFSAGHISTAEAREIVAAIREHLGDEEFNFFPGLSYRHLLVWRNGEKSGELSTVPPHDISGKNISFYLPQGPGEEKIRQLMKRAEELINQHPVNRARVQKGERPANAIWFWGQGKAPSLPSLRERFGLEGSVISAVDLIKGIGFYAGLEIVEVPGATGFLDTNYAGKVEYALREISRKDFVYLHVEAPDEASHNGSLADKIRAIEDFDGKIVGPVWAGLNLLENFCLLVLPDHLTPIAKKTHASEPVPFVLCSSHFQNSIAGRLFDEISGRNAGLYIERGHELMGELLERCGRLRTCAGKESP